MTRDETIKLAREAGFLQHGNRKFAEHEAILRFAALVAAAEREAYIHAAEVAISLVCDPVKAVRARGQL